MTTVDTVVRYEPRGAAQELFRTRASEVAMAGPAGTGKSLACLFRVHLAALNTPGIRCLIVRKTAVSLGATTLVTFEKKVAKHALEAGLLRWFGGSPREAACYRYENGSVIVVGGMDKPEKVLSSEYDLVFADEATELTETDWETLGTRLRNGVLPWQQQIAACNPDRPKHWIKQRSERGSMRMLHSRHLDALTGVRRLRYRDGIWAAAEGLIYEGWDDAIHLIAPFVIPEAWTRWLVVDFGFTNPFCAQWWAEDSDGRLYLYREIYRTKRLVEDHARHMLRLVTDDEGTWTEPRPRAVICDHDAEDRATLEKHLGMGTWAAKKGVSDGIQATQSRFKVQDDGRPRLFLMQGALAERDEALEAAKRPTCTEEEITGYVWAVKPGGNLKEEPLKEADHGMDAMRYMVAQRDIVAQTRVRWL
jgi:hypothetical protein